jgi:hypothetical protein
VIVRERWEEMQRISICLHAVEQITEEV